MKSSRENWTFGLDSQLGQKLLFVQTHISAEFIWFIVW